jgi:hypothetical protein
MKRSQYYVKEKNHENPIVSPLIYTLPLGKNEISNTNKNQEGRSFINVREWKMQ